jgi:hypothetical protein
VKTNVSFNALNGEGKPQGHQDEAIENGLEADVFAERVVSSLMAGDEYIVVGGKKNNSEYWSLAYHQACYIK